MGNATHIIRFIANEDGRVHLGQLVDTSRDVGLDSLQGKKIEAYLINGSIFNADVTSHVYTVKQLLSPVSTEECNYIRCLGLNYSDHANVSERLGMGLPTLIRLDRKQMCLSPRRPFSSPSLGVP